MNVNNLNVSLLFPFVLLNQSSHVENDSIGSEKREMEKRKKKLNKKTNSKVL